MTIYHPGKVIVVFSQSKEVISGDKKVQVLLEMWDENIFTCDVDQKIASKVKEGDIVLVDYSPLSAKITLPKHVVVKILKGKTAEKTWDKYLELKNRNMKEKNAKMPPQPPVQIYG